LVYLRPYSERQVKLHRIIKKLKEKRHMSLKSIADKLNALRIKTHRGKHIFKVVLFILFSKEKKKEING